MQFLDCVGVLNIRNAGRPPQIKRRYPVPGQLWLLLDRRRTAIRRPHDLRNDLYNRAFYARKWENWQVNQELREGVIEAAVPQQPLNLFVAVPGLWVPFFFAPSLASSNGAIAPL